MASTGRNTTQSDAGPSSGPSTTSGKRTYADVLKFTSPLGSNIQPKQSKGNLHVSPQAPYFQLQQSNGSLHISPQAPHFKISRELETAAHQVFRTPELLGMILAKLPLISNRSAMSVSKQFWAVLNPDAEHHLCGIKGALGIDFSRSIESLTDSEKADLKIMPIHIPEPRLEWLVNFELDLAFVDHRQAPFVKIWPFVFERMTGSLKHRKLDISLRLDAEDIDREYTESKGVYTPSKGRTMIYSNEPDIPARNWMDVKLLNLPFKVMVQVAVDFRKCMGAPSHHEGTCRVPGCQVGLFGIQRTFTTITPEKATMGEFIAFLDRIEHDSRNIAASIARRSLRYGPGFLGQNWYLGSSVPPPSLVSQYTGDYTLNALQYQPTKRTLEQMTPRSLREILFPEESLPK